MYSRYVTGAVQEPKRIQEDEQEHFMPEHVRHSVRKSSEVDGISDEDSDFD